MTKIHTTLTIDPDLFSEAKQTGMNMSAQFEEYLRFKLNQLKNDSVGVSLAIKKKEFEKAEKERLKWDVVSKRLRDEIVIDEQTIERKEVQRLQKERQSIELQKHCVYCKSLILPDSKFEPAFVLDEKEFFVHKSCFMDWIQERMLKKLDASKDSLRDWFKGLEGYEV